jgi:hypothetical protein
VLDEGDSEKTALEASNPEKGVVEPGKLSIVDPVSADNLTTDRIESRSPLVEKMDSQVEEDIRVANAPVPKLLIFQAIEPSLRLIATI